MQLTIDIKPSAFDKIMYFLQHLKDDVTILNHTDNHGDGIDVIDEDDEDYKYIVEGRKERLEHPENYGTMDELD